MAKTNTGLVKYVQKAYKDNWGYCLGTYGQILTLAVLKAKQRQGGGVGAYNTKHDKYLRKFIGKRVSDCYGLVKGYLWTTNGNLRYNGATDRNQEMAYNAAKEKGRLNTLPEVPGTILWMKGHAGVYIGNGEFIEIAGAPKGMIKGKIVNGRVTKGSRFTHWFKDTYIDYGKGTVTPSKPSKPTGAKWFGIGSPHNNKADVQKLQKDLVKLGFSVGSYGTNGVMGNDTAGAIGKFQAKYGLKVDTQAGTDTLNRIAKELNKTPQKPTTNVWYGIGSPHNTKTEVQKLQKDLVAQGYSVGSWGTNGVMGPDTANAIGNFQKANNLTVDKQAGTATLRKLDELQGSKTRTGTIKPRGGANVRAGAGTGYRKAMNALSYGTKVNVLREVNGWYEIEYQGKRGYIRKDLIK